MLKMSGKDLATRQFLMSILVIFENKATMTALNLFAVSAAHLSEKLISLR
jgi:hypothetical protein